MEPSPPADQAITGWLGDYTQFMCDQLGLSYDEGGELLQQYLDIITRIPTPSRESADLRYEQPTSYPEIQSPHRFGDQPPSASLADGPQNLPLSYSESSNLHHGPFIAEEPNHLSNHAAMTAPDLKPPGLFSFIHEQPVHEQPGQVTSDLDTPMATSPWTHTIGLSSQNSIGNIAHYDPLWVQHNNIDPTTVTKFQSHLKFDALWCNRIIKIGDVLTFQVSVDVNGQIVETEAHLKVTRRYSPAEQY